MQQRLPSEPFTVWLQARVNELGFANVAHAVGSDERMIRAYLLGYYYKAGKKYYTNFVQLATVDRYCSALGYHLRELYPSAYDE